jgi:hypothetical protein
MYIQRRQGSANSTWCPNVTSARGFQEPSKCARVSVEKVHQRPLCCSFDLLSLQPMQPQHLPQMLDLQSFLLAHRQQLCRLDRTLDLPSIER